jgi:hypothetical protein
MTDFKQQPVSMQPQVCVFIVPSFFEMDRDVMLICIFFAGHRSYASRRQQERQKLRSWF